MNYNDLGIDVKYLLTNKSDKNIGIVVNTVGFQTINSNSQYPTPKHPLGYYLSTQKGRILHEFQLIYITKGEGQLSIGNKQFTLKKGNIFLLCPNQWHSYMPTSETGWNEYYIGFDGNILFSLLGNLVLSIDNQVFDIGLNEELVKLYSRAIELAKFEKEPLNFHLSGLVYHMIGLFISEITDKKMLNKPSFQLVEMAKIIMNENVYGTIYPEKLAKKLNVNYNYFRKEFKKVAGVAPGSYYIDLKICKAKQLLLESTLSIKEISIKLQFHSSDYFTVIFKKKTGCTPNKYRATVRSN